jgi:hypothetical protein
MLGDHHVKHEHGLYAHRPARERCGNYDAITLLTGDLNVDGNASL